jgi:hypothetical protein
LGTEKVTIFIDWQQVVTFLLYILDEFFNPDASEQTLRQQMARTPTFPLPVMLGRNLTERNQKRSHGENDLALRIANIAIAMVPNTIMLRWII